MDRDSYAEQHSTPVEPFMAALERETFETQTSPGMLTGTVAGRLLATLVYALKARRVLEIGTYTGYSALAMAGALPPGGRVITCELDPDRAAFARAHMDASPYGDRIEIRIGPALQTVRSLDGEFDFVFIDADKSGYPDYFDAALPLLAPGGLIVLDNMLYGDRVLEAELEGNAAVLHALNERLAADPALVATMFPVRDGMTIVRRA